MRRGDKSFSYFHIIHRDVYDAIVKIDILSFRTSNIKRVHCGKNCKLRAYSLYSSMLCQKTLISVFLVSVAYVMLHDIIGLLSNLI